MPNLIIVKRRETSQHSGVMYKNQRAQINDLLFSHALRCGRREENGVNEIFVLLYGQREQQDL